MKGLCGVLAAFLLLGSAGCGVSSSPPTAVSPAAVAPSSAEGVLRAAIASRAAVSFVYSGVSRVAHPHRLGASAAGRIAGGVGTAARTAGGHPGAVGEAGWEVSLGRKKESEIC